MQLEAARAIARACNEAMNYSSLQIEEMGFTYEQVAWAVAAGWLEIVGADDDANLVYRLTAKALLA
jgi:hypothetical protein